jgi:sigma-B regulation protein RsbU (phosphoserine phosphatase)
MSAIYQNVIREVIDGEHEHDEVAPCAACHEALEPELAAAVPTAEVCLGCMDERQREQLESDLQAVQQMHLSLLPGHLPRTEGLEAGIHYVPSRVLSGDFYDVVCHPGSPEIGLAAGDVSGKGMPAGLLRVSLQSVLKVLGQQQLPPAELLRRANRHFLESTESNRYATVFYGILDRESDRLVYANGGHLPPLLRRSGRRWEALKPTGTVLGLLEGATYEERSCRFAPGDLLVLYTDGVTEAENPAGEFFEEPRLVAALERWADAPAQELADRIAAELARFAPGGLSDDCTLMVLRRSAVS